MASRMEFLDHLLQVIAIKMGVDLCSGDRFMAKHLLHGPKVCSTFYQVCCKRMTERVRTDIFFSFK
jgi:hypothetical protein